MRADERVTSTAVLFSFQAGPGKMRTTVRHGRSTGVEALADHDLEATHA
jgi:hypothetical protein